MSVEVLVGAVPALDVVEWVEMSEATETWRSAPGGPLMRLSRRSMADSGDMAAPLGARSGVSDVDGLADCGVFGLKEGQLLL